uniref:Uncharacterized protein n=1 Tax=Plectus sambesii TaxID=2011161 RepID=A0A914W2Q7_9BILA
MACTKICDSISPAVADPTDYHYGAYTDDGKVWLVSRTGHEQKTCSYFHRVAYNGGYLISFDTKTKKWGEKTTFDAVSNEENMEDVLFAVGSHLLMLLYSRFDGLKYHGLYEWVAESSAWRKIKAFEVEPAAETADEGRNELASVAVADGLYLVVTNGSGNVTISKLFVKTHGDHIDKAEVSSVGSLSEDVRPFHHHGHVVMGGVYKDKLALIGGTHGCGFRWEPNQPTVFRLNDKTAAKLEITGETPPFSYSGSRETVVLPDGRWLHITGSTAHGMTGSTYNGQVWYIDLSKDTLQWEKTPLEVPEDMSAVVVVDMQNKKLFAAGLKMGVFEGQL